TLVTWTIWPSVCMARRPAESRASPRDPAVKRYTMIGVTQFTRQITLDRVLAVRADGQAARRRVVAAVRAVDLDVGRGRRRGPELHGQRVFAGSAGLPSLDAPEVIGARAAEAVRLV